MKILFFYFKVIFFLNSFTRYTFENLFREFLVQMLCLIYFAAWGLINLTNVPAEVVHLLGLRMQNIFVDWFGIILDVILIEYLAEMLRHCLLKTTRFLLGWRVCMTLEIIAQRLRIYTDVGTNSLLKLLLRLLNVIWK